MSRETLVELQCSCGREYQIPSSMCGDTFQCDCYMRIVVDTRFLREVPADEPVLPVASQDAMYESTTEVFTWVQPPATVLRPTIEPPRRSLDDEKLAGTLDRVVDVLERVEEAQARLEVKQLESVVEPLIDECLRLEQENERLARLVDATRDRGRVDLTELLARAEQLRGA